MAHQPKEEETKRSSEDNDKSKRQNENKYGRRGRRSRYKGDKANKQKQEQLEEKADYFNVEYTTEAKIDGFGRAIGIDLSDAKLPGNVKEKSKHVTLFFRKRKPKDTANIDQGLKNELKFYGNFTEYEKNWMEKYKQEWIDTNNDKQSQITFTIKKWGKRSVLIEGNLKNLCLYIRNCVESNDTIELDDGKERQPHAQLFK